MKVDEHLPKILFEIMEYIRSLHNDENHWLKLELLSDGTFFHSDFQRGILEFTPNVDIKVELEIHPSGRSIRDCTVIDCLVQEISVRIWAKFEDPTVYKWEFGSPTKLKKEDKNWCEGINLFEALELILEDATKNL